MTHADTPMPGEDPGALIEDPPRDDDLDLPSEGDVGDEPRPDADAPSGAAAATRA